jgi:hypothetical protein
VARSLLEGSTSQPLPFLGRLVLRAVAPPHMRSLPIQFASSIGLLADHLAVRGESSLQHYYAEALTLTCLRPRSSDIAAYESLLRSFVQFDRRQPALPPMIEAGALTMNEGHVVHFVQTLGDQSAFQPLYEAAQQLPRYGALSRPRRKIERMIVFARELAGQPLLGPCSAPEELYARVCETFA